VVVTYTDTLGSVGPMTYNKKLHEIYKWPDPFTQIDKLARELISTSGGAVQYSIERLEIDDFAPHVSGHLVWPPTATPKTPSPRRTPTPQPTRININPFTGWTRSTWPAYPDIPYHRQARWVENTTPYDWDAMLNTYHPKRDATVAELINNGVYDEVWLFTEPTGNYGEAAMVVPRGRNGLNINGPVVTPTQDILNRGISIGGYNLEREEMMSHSFGHRAENVFASVYHGNVKPTCLVNREAESHYNHYIRIVACHNDDRTSTPPPTIPSSYYGSIGVIHKSHNEPSKYVIPHDVNNPDRWDDPVAAESDANDWYNFPNFTGEHRPIDPSAWTSLPFKYYTWWLQHLPRYPGAYETLTPTPTANTTQTATPTPTGNLPEPGPWNNIWPYLAKPACYMLPAPRDNLTPNPPTSTPITPTATPTATCCVGCC